MNMWMHINTCMKLRLYLKSYNPKFGYDLSPAHFALTSPKNKYDIESLSP